MNFYNELIFALSKGSNSKQYTFLLTRPLYVGNCNYSLWGYSKINN